MGMVGCMKGMVRTQSAGRHKRYGLGIEGGKRRDTARAYRCARRAKLGYGRMEEGCDTAQGERRG